MTRTYIYTPEIWPLAAVIILMVFLAAYSWRRRSVPGTWPFMVGCVFTSLATLGLIMTHLAVEPGTKIFWFRFQASWLLPAVTAVTCFILEYAWPGRWLTRRNLVLLSILPLFFIFYFLGGGYSVLGSLDLTVSETVRLSLNPYGRLFTAYALTLTLVNLIVFTWLFVRSPQHRWPVVLMAASQIVTRLIMLGEEPSFSVQVFYVPGYALPYLAYAIALFGFRIFDPIQLAGQKAIDQLNAGMIVLDAQQYVVSLNPAAGKMLGTTTREAKGRLVREWLPVAPECPLASLSEAVTEFSRGSGPEQRHYTLTSSQLTDFRGLQVGCLLMLRDVTEQKRAQAQILEQQRALAIQDERERMGRELHDSLGQVLGYASLQAQMAAKLSRDGRGQAAAARLDRLDSVVREAHADLRESILNLRSTASLRQPFFPAIKQYLDGFTSNYDIQTLLNVSPGLSGESLAAETKLQLFRILQEALSNARRHGRAHQVQVTFSRQDERLCLSIQDDGCGFEPERATREGPAHYGLQFMRERAAQLGGTLELTSAPGCGTRIDLFIPWKEG